MAGRSIKELREELSRLMDEQIATLKKERFGGLSASEIRKQEELLTRIREVSADYLAALKRNDP
jgi:recombinational DNA repair ATPase RecF